MSDFYTPYSERSLDSQYRDRVRFILDHGTLVKDTPQGVGALTCFGILPPMAFNLANGAPVITDRKIGFWRKPIAEITAFINGARTVEQIESFGCPFWGDYREKGPKYGLNPGDLGPGSYGAAFHDFETPGGGSLNQFEQVIEQIKKYPERRTHLVTPWKPYYTAQGPNRKVVVAPCHGWLHFRVMGEKLHMRMDQRSADFPVGVPSNMVQYAALLLMVSRKTGYSPGMFVHSFSDAHIYENQIDNMRELVEREPRRLPTLRLADNAPDFFDIRPEHFTLEQYDPHPHMNIPYTP